MKWTSWVSLAGLTAIIGFVVYSSFQVGGVRCEVCITFEGQEACRSVDGNSEGEARQAAVNNTCAQLASGVTRTMACERTTPSREHCEPK
ncbi:MAG TPA: hypothetical protein VMS22_01250 [Candidatus Eisenbacteria bacterium]|jgi:hypothetical protein|nr:hypothetical protein [Candidatus Eisenbacteria bacterium]